jgi:predicted metal-dependent peptidase
MLTKDRTLEVQSERLTRAHNYLLRNPKVAMLSGIILLGKSSVEENVPTAYTDGLNKRYGALFMQKLNDEELNGLIMHENGHVFYRHVTHYKSLFKKDPKITNVAADFVVNDMIKRLDEPKIKLPPGALWNKMFRDWSLIQVYDYLKKRKEELDKQNDGQQDDGQQGSGSPSGETLNNDQGETDIDKLLKNLGDDQTLDEHDFEAGAELDEKELGEKVDRALRQGGILAGILGAKKDRSIEELLEPKVDWREVLRDFVTANTIGKDEYSWRKFNRRMLANDMYLPSAISETIGEIVVAIDTSGSISGVELSAFAGELASICDSVTPEKVRVLWWDTKVHGEQIFQGNYTNITTMLKPEGGGGTRVSCVSEYLINKAVNAECVVVFTDGFVENNVQWSHTAPLLWLVTDNKGFQPPAGKKVLMEKEV